MPINPIRVRGKKRPMAEMAPDTVTDSSNGGEMSLQLAKKPKVTKQARKRSILERMPVEILKQVFMESKNMALISCNRFLRATLKKEMNTVQLTAVAFAPTWDMYADCGRMSWVEDPNSYPQYDDDERKEIGRFQSSLINKRRVTIDVLLRAKQLWHDKLAETPRDGPGPIRAFEIAYKRAMAGAKKHVEGWYQYRDAQDVEPGVKLTPELLEGPWDEDRQKLIFWLVTGGIFVSHENWDRETSLKILITHLCNRDNNVNEFFVFGSEHLVNFQGWNIWDAYPFYRSQKPQRGDKHYAALDLICNRIMENMDDYDFIAIRCMRRRAGVDVNDSDQSYDSENDSDLDDYSVEGDLFLDKLRAQRREEERARRQEEEDEEEARQEEEEALREEEEEQKRLEKEEQDRQLSGDEEGNNEGQDTTQSTAPAETGHEEKLDGQNGGEEEKAT